MIGVTGATGRLGGRVAPARGRRPGAAAARPRPGSRPLVAGQFGGAGVVQRRGRRPRRARRRVRAVLGVRGGTPIGSTSIATSWRQRPPPASSTSSTRRSSEPRRLHVHPGPRPLRDRAAHPGRRDAHTFLRDNFYPDFLPLLRGRGRRHPRARRRRPGGRGRARADIARRRHRRAAGPRGPRRPRPTTSPDRRRSRLDEVAPC